MCHFFICVTFSRYSEDVVEGGVFIDRSAAREEGWLFIARSLYGKNGGLQHVSEGTLRWLSEETGYGLIRPDDGSRKLFVRSTDIANGEADSLGEGDEVRSE